MEAWGIGLKIPAVPLRAGLPQEFSVGEAAAALWLPRRAPLLYPRSCPAHRGICIPAQLCGQPVGRRKGRNTSFPKGSTAVEDSLCGATDLGDVQRTSPEFPLLTLSLWREGARLVAAPRLRNASVPARACLSSLPLFDSFPGKKSSRSSCCSPQTSQVWFDSRESPETHPWWQWEHGLGLLPATWHQCLGMLPGSPRLQMQPWGIPDKGPAGWGATASSWQKIAHRS